MSNSTELSAKVMGIYNVQRFKRSRGSGRRVDEVVNIDRYKREVKNIKISKRLLIDFPSPSICVVETITIKLIQVIKCNQVVPINLR